MFYKVGSDWKEFGVGNLFLKPCDGKTQLLVRADTSLGKIKCYLSVCYRVRYPQNELPSLKYYCRR